MGRKRPSIVPRVTTSSRGECLPRVGEIIKERVEREEFGAGSEGTSDDEVYKGGLGVAEASIVVADRDSGRQR